MFEQQYTVASALTLQFVWEIHISYCLFGPLSEDSHGLAHGPHLACTRSETWPGGNEWTGKRSECVCLILQHLVNYLWGIVKQTNIINFEVKRVSWYVWTIRFLVCLISGFLVCHKYLSLPLFNDMAQQIIRLPTASASMSFWIYQCFFNAKNMC